MTEFKLEPGEFPKSTKPRTQMMLNRLGEEVGVYLALVRSGGLDLSDYEAMHLAVMMWCGKSEENILDWHKSYPRVSSSKE